MISIVYPYFLIPVAAIAYLFVTTSNFCEYGLEVQKPAMPV